jgi:hypothetical protein
MRVMTPAGPEPFYGFSVLAETARIVSVSIVMRQLAIDRSRIAFPSSVFSKQATTVTMRRSKYTSLLASCAFLISIAGCSLSVVGPTVFPQTEFDAYFATRLDAQDSYSYAQDVYEAARQEYFISLDKRYSESGWTTGGPADLAFQSAIAEIKRQTALFKVRMETIDIPPECERDHDLYLALVDLMMIYPDAEGKLIEDIREFGSPTVTTMTNIDSLRGQIDRMRAELVDTGAICVSR